MNWIKSHLTLVICAAVSVIAIALLVLGLMISEVQEVMAADSGMLQRLKTVQPVNQQILEQLRKQRETLESQVRRTMEQVEALSQHKPLHEDVFPAVNPLKQEAPFQFKHAYAQALQQLLVTLKAKDAPSPEEIEEEKQRMEAERLKAERLSTLGVVEEADRRRSVSPPGPAQRDAGSARREMTERRAGMTPEELAREDPIVRVSILKARSIYCYASADSFHPRSTIVGVDRPTVEEMWYAQMALWIQQDIVNALAGLNNRVAEELAARNVAPWVGNLPVKHVLSFEVGGYLPPTAGGGGGGGEFGGPAAPTTLVWTPRGSSASVDIIHFAVDMVVEARLLPTVIDVVSSAGFYTVLEVDYQEVPPNTTYEGYIYGSDPAIRLQLAVEGCFPRAKYEKLIPETVKAAIQAGTAVSQAVSGGGAVGRPGTGGEPRRPGPRRGGEFGP